MQRLTIRLLHEVIAPKFLGDASIVERIKIVFCARIWCCCGDGQTGFAEDKSPEKTETENRVASLNEAMWGLKHQHERL